MIFLVCELQLLEAVRTCERLKLVLFVLVYLCLLGRVGLIHSKAINEGHLLVIFPRASTAVASSESMTRHHPWYSVQLCTFRRATCNYNPGPG